MARARGVFNVSTRQFASLPVPTPSIHFHHALHVHVKPRRIPSSVAHSPLRSDLATVRTFSTWSRRRQADRQRRAIESAYQRTHPDVGPEVVEEVSEQPTQTDNRRVYPKQFNFQQPGPDGVEGEARSEVGERQETTTENAGGMDIDTLLRDYRQSQHWKSRLMPPGQHQAAMALQGVKQPGSPKVVTLVLLGAPNAGKSALANLLIGAKVNAVSPKRNTTRNAVLGVHTDAKSQTQMILYDTPGVVDVPEGQRLERSIVSSQMEVGTSAQVALIVVDAVKNVGPWQARLLQKAAQLNTESGVQLVLVMNKMDLVTKSIRHKVVQRVEDIARELSAMNATLSECFYVSATFGDQTKDLLQYIVLQARSQPWLFDAGVSTDLSPAERVIEMVREKLYCRLNQELPYLMEQRISSWLDRPDGSLVINMDIVVKTKIQQAIVVGKDGKVLKYIGTEARKDLIKMFPEKKVSLFIRVVRSKDTTQG